MACDPYFADVSLLLHCDGSNGSTTFVDSSSVGNVMSASHVQIDTAAPAFGTGALQFVTSAGVLTTPISNGGPLDLGGTVDFTIEGWLKLTHATSGDQGQIMSDFAGSPAFWFMECVAEGGSSFRVEMQMNTTSGAWTAESPAFTATAGVWYPFAVVMSSGALSAFISGNQGVIEHTTGTREPSSGSWHIGESGNGSVRFLGELDEIRVTKGFARYTSNYTPAGPFPDGACATVPNVVGEALASAASDIVTAGFVVGTETPQVSLTVPDGDVISQNPAGGTYEAAGSAVNLVYSIGDSFSAPVLSGSVPNPVTQPLAGVLTWTESLDGATPAPGYDIYRDGVSIATVGAVLTYTDTVPTAGTYTYNVAAYDSTIPADISAKSNSLPLTYSGSVVGFPNCIFDEAIFGGYFGGLLNLVEFTYMPGRTPFEEGATNLIINRYKQEPTDVRQRGVDFTQFVVPGELLQTVAVTGISAQGVLQDATNPLVIPLVVTDLIIDPVTQLKFGYTVSGGQNGIEYTVQFTTTTNIQTETLEEIFSINVLVEDSFP